MRCATCASSTAQPEAFDTPDEALPVFGTIASQFNDPGTNKALSAPRRQDRERPATDRREADLPTEESRRRSTSSRRSGRATSRRSPNRVAPTTAGSRAEPKSRAKIYRMQRRDRELGTSQRGGPGGVRRTAGTKLHELELQLDGEAPRGQLEEWPAKARAVRAARSTSSRSATRRSASPPTRVPVPPSCPRSRCPSTATGATSSAGCCRRTCPALPLHRGRLPVQARGRGSPPACSRARAAPSAPTGASTTSPRACRPSAAVDGLRLGHALRRGPRRAPRHLRQDRQLGRLDLLPGRRQEALLGLRPLRPEDLGLHDDQRSGADAAGLLHERGHRPAVREVHPRRGARGRGRGEDRAQVYADQGVCRPELPGRCSPRATTARAHAAGASPATRCCRRRLRADQGRHAEEGPRHGAGRHPQGGSGAEHLHLLDRVRAAHDGRHPAVLHRPRRCGTSTRSRSAATTSPRPARTRSPARLHARQRLHLRRVLPLARDGHRRVRAEPVVLLQQRPRPRVHGDRARRAAHLGQGDARTSTAATSAARSSSTTSRRGRSLHAQEIAFNDIRTTLQALYAIYDNCNSLHTNAYDEAITTPTEESVRRAMAIQLIINKELGWRRTRTRCRAPSSSRS
jgi:hypothetical protein